MPTINKSLTRRNQTSIISNSYKHNIGNWAEDVNSNTMKQMHVITVPVQQVLSATSKWRGARRPTWSTGPTGPTEPWAAAFLKQAAAAQEVEAAKHHKATNPQLINWLIKSGFEKQSSPLSKWIKISNSQCFLFKIRPIIQHQSVFANFEFPPNPH